MQHFAAMLQQTIDDAVAHGKHSLTVTGNHTMEQTVLLPSDFTLILDNCHLTMAEGTFCNMFRNASCGTEAGLRSAGCDRNIIIEGRGDAVLDGGVYNGLSERNSGKDGRPHISVNNTILFVNVEYFRVSGIRVINQRWWGLNFVACRFGTIRDVDFCSCDLRREADGSLVHGLGDVSVPGAYEAAYVKNSDGIDLRAGCHDILIENVTGFTEDDTVALTCLPGNAMHKPADLPDEIYNVTVRNVHAAAFCAVVRLLNQGGGKLYNIVIDGVFDASSGNRHLLRGGTGVRIGDTHLYGSRHATREETMNVTVKNVFSRASVAALSIAGEITNLRTENIVPFDGCGARLVNDARVFRTDGTELTPEQVENDL